MLISKTPLPIVDVMIPTGREDHIALPQGNVSFSGYGRDSLRDIQLGSSDVRAQEISILPQVDGPVIDLARGYTRGRVSERPLKRWNRNIPREADIFKELP